VALLLFKMSVGGFMNTAVIIDQIDKEISRLQQAKAVLTGATATPIKRAPGRPKTSKAVERILSVTQAKRVKRVVSVEAKAKMAQAQTARWAKVRRAAKKAAKAAALKSTMYKEPTIN
jgi:hypothetical protein